MAAVLTAIYVDFRCPFSRRAWGWLSHLPERAEIEVRPWPLDPDDVWDRLTSSWGLELLALGELAREGGQVLHHRFVDAAFLAAQGASDAESVLALADDVGLDLERFAGDGERWRAEVGLWQREAEDELGVSGIPTLVFDGDRTLCFKLEDMVPAAAARQLLDALVVLVDLPVAAVERGGA